ncbi:MAG: 3'-5' exonuclease [Bacteroidota bacterium]|nr:3'-5' exonuclease [Bacteroidota bacterium]
MEHFLQELNPAQKSAVLDTEGPSMVIAGAGSGKTKVLTYKIAYLLSKGINPFNILSLTFTNKAAREMKSRITSIVGSEARNVWMGTFHSVFSRILRQDGHLLGYPANFTIYDTNDSKNLIRAIVRELNLDTKIYSPNNILGRISSSKNNLISAKSYNSNTELLLADKAAGKAFIGKIFTMYTNRLFKSDAMDFDDLLFNTNLLFRDHPDILHKYQQQFKYVLVDEYQDTNYAQYLIIKKLSANNENICVVGDDAQSIYSFRGANIQNILNFKNDYPDYNLYKLEQNYRSTKIIVNAANGIIDNNRDQIKKIVWTTNEQGLKIPLLRAATDSEEGIMISESIFQTKMNYQLQNKEFAILYRTNAQSRSIEEALRKKNIDYKIYGGLSFYQRKEIKDLLSYYRLIINENDEEALLRIINYPTRGIGKTSQQHITIAAKKNNISMWQVMQNLGKYQVPINSSALNRLNQFVTMINSFKAQVKKKDAYELAKQIAITTTLLRTLNEDKTPEGVSKFENVEELLNAIYEFTEKDKELNEDKTLPKFLEDVALLTDQDDDDKNESDKVSLMTIHASKGLEFPYVYIIGLEENLFPSAMSLSTRPELEEERRLFYVALTRAEKRISLSYSENRYKWGTLTSNEPSRFIEEVDPQFLEEATKSNTILSGKPLMKFNKTKPFGQSSGYKKLKSEKSISSNMKSLDTAKQKNTSLFPTTSTNDFTIGMMVEHLRFGKGKIINIDGNNSNKKATVFFPGIGQKNLLLKFARLKIIK